MQRPSMPLDETTRLESLRGLNVLDTPAEERFDRITRLAQRILDTPIVIIGLVDGRREWFKSSLGIAIPQIARDASFGAHAIHASDVFIVEDTRRDPRFHDHPLVAAEPFVRFYAAF